jgi:hypothetical protein
LQLNLRIDYEGGRTEELIQEQAEKSSKIEMAVINWKIVL